MTTIKDIYNCLDHDYPFALQEPWDNSGLLCGDEKNEVKTCLVSLDITDETIRYAEQIHAELIISHHPIIFTPQKNFLACSPAYKAVRSGIAVISSHTCFDKAPTGTNYILSEILGIPTDYTENALFRFGTLQNGSTARQIAMHISEKLGAAVFCNLENKTIKKVAICTGAGGSEAEAAFHMGADLYITGEVKYHEFTDATAVGMAVIAAGHFETEDPCMTVLRDRLAVLFPDLHFIKYTPKPPITVITR